MSKTNLLASACLTAIALVFLLATIYTIAMTPKMIRHAGCGVDPSGIAAMRVAFKGGFAE